jgi:hypothetical protein
VVTAPQPDFGPERLFGSRRRGLTRRKMRWKSEGKVLRCGEPWGYITFGLRAPGFELGVSGVQAGGELEQIQFLLGHASVETTRNLIAVFRCNAWTLGGGVL